jgi:hypothetical protein
MPALSEVTLEQKITLTDRDRDVLVFLARRSTATVGELQEAMGPGSSYAGLCGRVYRLARAGLVESGKGCVVLGRDVVVAESGWVGVVDRAVG